MKLPISTILNNRTLVVGYIVSLLSAAGYGTGTVIGKFIIENHTSPLITTAYGLLIGTLFVAIAAVPHARRDIAMATRREWLMAILAGLSGVWGILFYLFALDLAPAVIVSPVASIFPLFVIVLSYLFLKHLERITWQLIVGALLVVGGVASIAIGSLG